ncbi:MAG: calcineurin-like phosphoesterase C-terminal domain-containing protein [Isosphaeraceae bacterium]
MAGRLHEPRDPHTTMGDAPNGYSIFTFDGNHYEIEFRPASRPKDYQMNTTLRSG